jgi:hypothetical protein
MNVEIVLEIAPEDVAELARGNTLITHIAGTALHIIGSEELRREYEKLASDGQREENLVERFEKEVSAQEEVLKNIIGDGQNGDGSNKVPRKPANIYEKKRAILSVFENGEVISSSEILRRLEEMGVYISEKSPYALGQWISRNMSAELERRKDGWAIRGQHPKRDGQKQSSSVKVPRKWLDRREELKQKIKALHDRGEMPDTLTALLIQKLDMPAGGNYSKFVKEICEELGIPAPNGRKKKLKEKSLPAENRDGGEKPKSPIEIFERAANEALINNLSEEELRELQRLYTHHTYGERVWDDELTPPERRVLRQLEEKGLCRSTTEERDKMKPRYFWEIKPQGIELLEGMCQVPGV